MKLFRAAVAVAAIASPAALAGLAVHPARAQPVDGLYVGAGAGGNLMQDTETSIGALAGRTLGGGVQESVPNKVSWGAGYLVSGSIGYGFGNGVRVELEGDYRDNAQEHGDGRQTQYGVMANVLYDVDIGEPAIFPYVGMGIGYQSASWHNVTLQAHGIDAGPGATSVVANQTLGGLGYQAIVGVAFPIDALPGLSLTAEYRYANRIGARNYRAVGTTPGVSGFASNATHVHATSDANHTVMLGLRYAFDTPESAPVERPPPAPDLVQQPVPGEANLPAPARTYLVFFDWDQTDLTPRAREVIAEAVRNSARIPHTRIEVAGHADRTGSAAVNQALSLRRAQVVAAEMMQSGIPGGSIEIHAYGDSRPLIATGPGIRQPENRRVEIVYR